MSVDWQPETQEFDLSGLGEAIVSFKPRHKQHGGDETEVEGNSEKGMISKLISAASYDRCTVSKTLFPDEKIAEMHKGVELVCFRRKLTSREVITEVQKMNKCLASPAYVLAIGFLYPNEQKAAPIVQLNASVELPPIVLSSSCYGRNATLGHFDGPGWPEHTRFVLVDDSSDFIECDVRGRGEEGN